MLVASFLVYSWSALPDIAFTGLEQPGVKGEEWIFESESQKLFYDFFYENKASPNNICHWL